MTTPDRYLREGAEAMREAMLKAVQVNIRTMLERLNVTSMVHDIDVDAVLAGLQWQGPGEAPHRYSPDYMAQGDCQICGHTWEAHQPTPDPVARLVEAARVFASWDHCWPGNINLEAACRDIREALAAMGADDDLL